MFSTSALLIPTFCSPLPRRLLSIRSTTKNALEDKWIDSSREKLGGASDRDILEKTFDRMNKTSVSSYLVEIEDAGNGRCRIWCDTLEKCEIIQKLGRDLIEKETDEDIVSSRTPPSQRKRGRPVNERPVRSLLTVQGTYADVSFALQDMIKLARPYPRKKR